MYNNLSFVQKSKGFLWILSVKELSMGRLKQGDTAPNFELPDQDGRIVKMSDYKGQQLLVYFYPKANTPGCTTQSCEVRDARADFSALGVAVVGISPDAAKDLKRFDEKYNLGFPLLSDAEHIVAEAYGVWGEKSMHGKKYMGIIRSSFLIQENGKVRQAWYKISPKDTVPQARQAISDKLK
jgi:peroxiredoxin Q/BCP